MNYGKQDYTKYTDEMLVIEWEEALDLDENIFFILPELADRNHPNTIKYCMDILQNFDGVKFFESSVWNILYHIDEQRAIDFVHDNFNKIHTYTFGTIASQLWTESNDKQQTDKKREFIKSVKKELKKLNKKEIEEIKDDYDDFMEAYKNL